MKANVWLERNVVNTRNFTNASSILTNGVYSGIVWDPATEITGNMIYSVKASIAYGGKTYNGAVSFSKGDMGQIGTDVTALQSSLDGMVTDVALVAAQVDILNLKVDQAKSKITDVDTGVADVASAFGAAKDAGSAILGQLSDVSLDVSAIDAVGGTLTEVSAKITSLSTQFAVMEAAMTGIDLAGFGQSIVRMDVIYSNLVNMAAKVKEMNMLHVQGWDDVFDISQEQSTDMQYLKNKTRELKAIMEINKKLMENVVQEKHEPVTQTWFEFN